MEPVKTSVPLGPTLLRLNPDPDIFPPIVTVLPVTVIDLFPLRITFPVPMLSALVFAKEKSVFQYWVLFVARVTKDPVVEPTAPPLMVSAPVPMAEALLRIIVPEVSVVPPE